MAEPAADDQPTGEALAAVRAAVDIIPMAAVAHTANFVIVAANSRCADVLGVPVDRIQGRLVRDFLPTNDRAPARETAEQALRSARVRAGSMATSSSFRRVVRADGGLITCWMHVGVATVAGHPLFIACMDLVNPVVSHVHEWRRRAEHDELTGLLRRGALLSHLQEWIHSERGVDLAFLDVDDFKSVNDTHGHACGDHVLSVIAHRLTQAAPEGCLVSRLSGDEFVLARPSVQPIAGGRTPEGAGELVEAAGLCDYEPVAWNDHLLMLSTSVGGVSRQPGEDAATLLARADAAMYEHKLRRRDASGRL
jgi:diguanylate cyclase (GGDEF)-like protein/PAS domain S-box-containing protein